MKKLFLLLSVLLLQQQVRASLSPTDQELMTTNLEILENGWVQSSVDICNSIILNTNYTAEDWLEFFQDYYADHLLTEELWSYLGYPMFWWFSETIHYSLQRAHQLIFLEQTDDLLARADLAVVLANQPAEREHLFSMLKVLNLLAAHEQSVLSAAQQDAILQNEENWINQYPAFYKRGNHLDPNTQPYRALIGLQLHITLLSSKELTADRIEELNQLFGFSGMYSQIFLNHGVYIADNERMSDADLNYLNEFFSQLPTPMAPLNLLSSYDYYYTTTQPRMPIDASLIRAVNTFSTVGGDSENSFPSDISPRYIDGFSVVVAHEITHIIDAVYLAADAAWVERKAQLLEQAGDTDLEYLRSMIGADYFQNAPQEFLASIGNEWFTSSEHTLQLGLLRFDNGYHEPINQFLFFCELFSQGGSTVPFYTIDTEANITVEDISGERDTYGHLKRLTVGDVTYDFELDPDGNVLAWRIYPPPNECLISDLTAGAQTACDPATNTYTQEVIISYSNAPASGALEVNGQSFPIESSPQTVTLTDLVANAALVDVTAEFTDAASCSATAAALFRAPRSCSTPPDASVVSFILVDAVSNQDFQALPDNAVLDAGSLPDQINIRAVTDPVTVGSVVLQLSGPTNDSQTENVAPYALFGDSGGDYRGKTLPVGDYTLTATPYSSTGGLGAPGTPLTIAFRIADEPAPFYTVTLSDDGNGATSGGGAFPAGSTVTVTATPDAGYQFTNWTDGSVVSTANPYSFTLTQDVSLQANFEELSSGNTVVQFVLIDAATNQPVPGYNPIADDAVLDASALPSQLNIQAVTNPATVGSVVLELTGAMNKFMTENVAPYALFGDSGGDYAGESLPVGDYTLVATPFSDKGGLGTPGTHLVISFQVVAEQPVFYTVTLSDDGNGATSGGGAFPAGSTVTVTATPDAGYQFANWTDGSVVSTANPYSFTLNRDVSLRANFEELSSGNAVVQFVLIDAATNQPVPGYNPITDGAVLDASTLPSGLNIQAVTDPPTVGSVALELRGPESETRTENVAPYALFGDSGGDYRGEAFSPGEYTLTATPYAASGASGTAGSSLTIGFTVVEGSESLTAPAIEGAQPSLANEELSVQLFPNPARTQLSVRFFLPEATTEVMLRVSDLSGKTLLQRKLAGVKGWQDVTVEVDRMTSGIYLLHLVTGEKHVVHQFGVTR